MKALSFDYQKNHDIIIKRFGGGERVGTVRADISYSGAGKSGN